MIEIAMYCCASIVESIDIMIPCSFYRWHDRAYQIGPDKLTQHIVRYIEILEALEPKRVAAILEGFLHRSVKQNVLEVLT